MAKLGIFTDETRETIERGVAPADCWNWGGWGLKEYKWKSSYFDWFVGLVVPLQGVFSALVALVGPVQNIIFLTVHYFNSFVPIDQQAGQTVLLGRLSLSICLWTKPSGHLALHSEECILSNTIFSQKKRITYDGEKLAELSTYFSQIFGN